MNRSKSIVVGALAALLAGFFGYNAGFKAGGAESNLLEHHFEVVDADTGSPIKHFSFTFPDTQYLTNGNRSAFPKQSTLRRGEYFHTFHCVSNQPVFVFIGADGYHDQKVSLDLSSEYSSSSGGLPNERSTIRLKSKAQQDGAGNPLPAQ